MRKHAPDQREREAFAGFCRNASDRQLSIIHAKEKAANRRVYTKIALRELERRRDAPIPDMDVVDLLTEEGEMA